VHTPEFDICRGVPQLFHAVAHNGAHGSIEELWEAQAEQNWSVTMTATASTTAIAPPVCCSSSVEAW
jgi:hypothetical protein